jgi:hypothetical protein
MTIWSYMVKDDNSGAQLAGTSHHSAAGESHRLVLSWLQPRAARLVVAPK